MWWEQVSHPTTACTRSSGMSTQLKFGEWTEVATREQKYHKQHEG